MAYHFQIEFSFDRILILFLIIIFLILQSDLVNFLSPITIKWLCFIIFPLISLDFWSISITPLHRIPHFHQFICLGYLNQTYCGDYFQVTIFSSQELKFVHLNRMMISFPILHFTLLNLGFSSSSFLVF